MEAPKAARKPVELNMHGHMRTDDYHWLNERENPDVLRYLEAENSYKDAMLAPTKELQEQLFNEMKGRIKEQDESVPYFYNGYTYYTRFIEGGEYPIYCRKKGRKDGMEEILLDCNDNGKRPRLFQCHIHEY